MKTLNGFLTEDLAAELLGISIDELRNINTIYKMKFDGNTIYLKRSLDKYKETGDGRFPIFEESDE